jgi:hypothetical protein
MSVHPGLRSLAVALVGVAIALPPKTSSGANAAAGAAASAPTQYSFAQSSLGGGGFENVIAADPRHNGVVVSGSDVGGVQRSTDFGKTWLPAEGGAITSTYHPVAAIAFDPGSPNDVYMATNGGFAESIDDGVTWSPLPGAPAVDGSNTGNPSHTASAERCVGRLIAVDDSTTQRRVYAASFNQGVWMHSGSTWTLVAGQAQLGGSAVCLTSLAWGPGGALDVATWGAGVFTIHNPAGGAPTVQAVPGAPVVVQELVGLADGDVWGAAYDTGVGVITASGWATKLVAGGERYMSIDGYVSGTADTVIAGSDNSQPVSGQPGLHAVLHETANSGATWTSLPLSTGQVSKLLGPQESTWWHASYAPALLGSQTMVPSSIALEHERGGDDLWVAGFGGNWRLLGAEGQSTFYPSDDGLGSTVNHQIALDPTTSGQSRSGQRVYLGDTDWGMFSSGDGFSSQQGIADDQFSGGGTTGYDTVVDGAVSPPVVYVGVGTRDSNTQGDVMSATAPATASASFQSLGLSTATGGGRPLALAVVDTAGTPTLIVAVEASGIWTRVGSGAWTRDASLFATDESPTAAIATGSGAQADTVYAYDRTIGVYRSLDAGAPGSWTLIWKHASLAAVPFLMVDSADPTRLWVSAVGGLYRLDGAASSTFASLSPVVAGTTAGLAELGGQVFTTQVAGANLELEVSDASGANFSTLGVMNGMPASASSIAVAGDGTVYIATAGWGVIVGTPVDSTTTSLTSTPDPSRYQKPVTFKATVTAAGGGATPAGAVIFWNGTRQLGSANLDASGSATFSSTKLSRGSHSIVATYQGDAGDTASTSSAIVQTVT